MKVAVFGGTGFVGSYLLDALLARNMEPVVLVRRGSEAKLRQRGQTRWVTGDVSDPAAVAEALRGADAVIYNIGILREFPKRGITFEALHFEAARRVMDLAGAAGVRRFLLMSANGVKAEGTQYQVTKYRAEQYLQATELEWTIIRPSVIFGDPRGRMEIATQLYRDIVMSPLPAPLFFRGLLPIDAGGAAMSPVHVQDVATVFAESLRRPETIARTLRLGGPEALSWREILERVAQAGGRRLISLPAPAWGLKAVARLFEGFDRFPITGDQVTMLMEGNTCDSGEIFEEFGVDPLPFDLRQLDYLRNASSVRTGKSPVNIP
jgi:uncharacterized protein YbjT (DUF2867 family)